MIAAFALALGQLTDGRVLGILAKCLAITLALFALLGTLGWHGLDALLAWVGLSDGRFAGAGELRGVAAFALVIIGGWLLWRILALAVLQFFADEVVEAVEARHYPAALAAAHPLGWREELRVGLRAALRTAGYNLLALPLALVLLITGIGTALVFLAVNAVLLGRELTEMVWLRHRHEADAPLPLGRGERFVLGGIVAGLFAVPVANLLAPVIGAAMATHLVHRKRGIVHAS
jgi:uncharacterized protein involved in cysteine biosynthesis